MRDDKENLIVKLTFEFALDIIEFSELLESRKKFVIARQILKSGTSIGANVREAQNAESKADFIHKMKIAAKEASESLYWLSVCEKSDIAGFQHELMSEVTQIIAIISKIIISAKKNI